MSKFIDESLRVVEGISRWPFVAIVAVLCLAPAVSSLIGRIDTLNYDQEKKQIYLTFQKTAAQQIAAASASRPSGGPITISAEGALETTKKIDIQRTIGRRVLWVDDNPTNNFYQRQSLAALGMTVENVLSTEQALEALRGSRFDIIISDMGRGSNDRAGFDLLTAVKEARIATPLIFYTATATTAGIAEAKAQGAFGETNRPDELVRLVASALGAY